jgi:hypothetical protein
MIPHLPNTPSAKGESPKLYGMCLFSEQANEKKTPPKKKTWEGRKEGSGHLWKWRDF